MAKTENPEQMVSLGRTVMTGRMASPVKMEKMVLRLN